MKTGSSDFSTSRIMLLDTSLSAIKAPLYSGSVKWVRLLKPSKPIHLYTLFRFQNQPS
ncbi:hypothetical protein D3C81_2090950 [compost metagenome]